tara:strand:- start:284 stop:454 length:171 start_codon:yes stop_codon:yes gene_type:complete
MIVKDHIGNLFGEADFVKRAIKLMGEGDFELAHHQLRELLEIKNDKINEALKGENV